MGSEMCIRDSPRTAKIITGIKYVDIVYTPFTQLISPEKAIKLNETIEAAISVDGIPLKVAGMSAVSSLERTPENRISASEKPAPANTAFTTDCRKVYPLSIFRRVTPSTAQLVVISGR
mgnify:FL=1